MLSYVIRRVALAVVVLFGLLVATFFIIHLVPGDPVRIVLAGRANPAEIARVRHQLASMVLTDPLTACLNRRGFDQALTRELARSTRAVSELSLRVERGQKDGVAEVIVVPWVPDRDPFEVLGEIAEIGGRC